MTFTPTHAGDAMRTPTNCFVCGFHAAGAGIGDAERGDPRFLCDECLPIANAIKATKRLDPYEINAVIDGGKAGGTFLDHIGKTDLAELAEEEFRVFCRKVIEGFAASLRRQIVEGRAPF